MGAVITYRSLDSVAKEAAATTVRVDVEGVAAEALDHYMFVGIKFQFYWLMSRCSNRWQLHKNNGALLTGM
jgi:hypothetical protein